MSATQRLASAVKSLLLALACLVCAPAGLLAEDCTLLKLASLPITWDESGRPLVPVEINGTERKFLVDTGGAFSAVTPALAQELGLRAKTIGSHAIYTNSGAKITEMVTVETLKIGISTDKHADLMLAEVSGGAEGKLAPDYLENFDLDFDFDAKTLNLISPDHCPGKAVYWTRDYAEVPFRSSPSRHIVVPMLLDGQKVSALIDTGGSSTFLSRSRAGALFGLRYGSPELEPVPGAQEGDLVRFRHRFQTLSVEGISVKNPLVYLHEDAAKRTFDRDFSGKTQYDPVERVELETEDLGVGMNILGKLHLYIAYKEHMLYVSGAGASARKEEVSAP